MSPLPTFTDKPDEFKNTPDQILVVKRLKRQVKLKYCNEDYVINKYGCICLETKPDCLKGKSWFSYGGKLNEFSMMDRATIVDCFSHGREWNGQKDEMIHNFTGK